MEYFLFNLETMTASKRSWKTYKGAVKNVAKTDLICTEDGIAWCKRNLLWCQSKLKQVLNNSGCSDIVLNN